MCKLSTVCHFEPHLYSHFEPIPSHSKLVLASPQSVTPPARPSRLNSSVVTGERTTAAVPLYCHAAADVALQPASMTAVTYPRAEQTGQ